MFNQRSDVIYKPINWTSFPENHIETSYIYFNSIEKKIFEENKTVKMKPKGSCVNCGAPLNGFKCEYCGTEYEYKNANF